MSTTGEFAHWRECDETRANPWSLQRLVMALMQRCTNYGQEESHNDEGD